MITTRKHRTIARHVPPPFKRKYREIVRHVKSTKVGRAVTKPASKRWMRAVAVF